MSLQQILDETIPPPPQFVSVDEVIARERRARKHRRSAVLGAATALVVIVVGITAWSSVPFLQSPEGGSGPFRPAADPALQQLDEAIRAAFAKEAPDIEWLPTPMIARRPSQVDPRWYSAWSTASDPNQDGPTYFGSAVFRTGGLVGTLNVNINRQIQPTVKACSVSPPPGLTCETIIGPHGELIISETIAYPTGPGEPRQFEYMVEVARPEGTHVNLSVRNQSGTSENDAATGEPVPLTTVQLQWIAMDPTLVALAPMPTPS